MLPEIDVQIKLDPKPLNRAARRLDDAARRAVPAALQEALTVVAFRARKAQRENAKAVLDRPKPFTISSFAARKAGKVGNDIESAVFVLPRMEAVLTRLEFGATLDEGFSIVDKRLEDRYGGLPKRFWPKRLPAKKRDYFEGEINGVRGIWQRLGKNRNENLKLAIAYVERPTYDPQLGFVDVAIKAGQTFRQEAFRQLNRRLQKSLKS